MELSLKQFELLIKQHFGAILRETAHLTPRHLLLTVDKKHLDEVCRYLKTERQGRLLTMVGNDERGLSGCLAVYYVYAFDKYQSVVSVKISVSEDEPTFPSLAADYPAVNWYEREVKDMFGLRALGHPDRRPLVLHGDWPEDAYPLRKDFPKAVTVAKMPSQESFMEYGGEVVRVPVGPIHAGIIEPGHFRFGVVGDSVLHLDARLFYTHRGVEKSLEGRDAETAVLGAERICGVCAASHAAAYAQAVESAAQLEIPPRAKFLRVILLELERLYNHVGDVGNICAGFGQAVIISHGSRLKEQLLSLNERLTGSRYLRGAIRVGGLLRDLTMAQLLDVTRTVESVADEFTEITEMLLSHDIALDRMATTGVLTKNQADDLETVGVAARASGRSVDCRRDQPYAAYDQLEFTVPVDEHGDVLARMNIRIAEVYQTVALIRQAVEKLPNGAVFTAVGAIKPYSIGVSWTESARGENCHWVMIGEGNTVYRCRVRSAAYSNWPAVALAVPGNIVPDFPLINKSFELCYACCDR